MRVSLTATQTLNVTMNVNVKVDLKINVQISGANKHKKRTQTKRNGGNRYGKICQ